MHPSPSEDGLDFSHELAANQHATAVAMESAKANLKGRSVSSGEEGCKCKCVQADADEESTSNRPPTQRRPALGETGWGCGLWAVGCEL